MYEVKDGDTLRDIAIRVYGTEQKANDIQKANPGLGSVLKAGTKLITPSAGLPNSPSGAPADNPDEVALIINGERYRFWTEITIERAIDSIDTISFSAPFDHETAGFKDTFRPFSYQPIQVTAGGAPLFTGTMVGIQPNVTPDFKSIDVSGYATCGVLSDCHMPASALPIEYNNLNLQQIATQMLEPFGLVAVFVDDPGAAFERVACEPTQTVIDFLTDLANQRGLVVGSDQDGNLLFQKSVGAGLPLARFEQGTSPLTAVVPFFNPQDYYSHITGFESVEVGNKGSQFTAVNDRLEGVLRPHNFNPVDSEGGAIKEAVNAKLGRMFGNMAGYRITVPTWRDPNGELWTPNTTVTLTAPDAMIYSEYEFIVRAVTLEATRDTKVATLDLAMPGIFSGELPERLPWDE